MPPTRVGHGREHGLTLTVDGEATVAVGDDPDGVTLSVTPARRRGRRRAVTLPVRGALSVAAALCDEPSDDSARRDVETVRSLRGKEVTVRTTPRGSFEVCLAGRRRGRRVAVVPDHETARSLAADLRQAAGDVSNLGAGSGGEAA